MSIRRILRPQYYACKHRDNPWVVKIFTKYEHVTFWNGYSHNSNKFCKKMYNYIWRKFDVRTRSLQKFRFMTPFRLIISIHQKEHILIVVKCRKKCLTIQNYWICLKHPKSKKEMIFHRNRGYFMKEGILYERTIRCPKIWFSSNIMI